MGQLQYNEWGRLLALSAATWMVWGSFWAFFYRKFFWDIVGGSLGPNGIIPGPNSKVFVEFIVNIPIIQVLTMIMGFFALAYEWPLPFFKATGLHCSLAFRVGFYLVAGFLCALVYQLGDLAVYFLITSIVFGMAIKRGEVIGKDRGEASEV